MGKILRECFVNMGKRMKEVPNSSCSRKWKININRLYRSHLKTAACLSILYVVSPMVAPKQLDSDPTLR